MTTTAPDRDGAFAELLDELVDALLAGQPVDTADVARRHPAVADRIAEAMALAASVAGRRTTAAPSLRGYRIVRELGRGGMGTVYLARQEQLDRDVAIKVLPHSFGLSAHSRQRFLEEARALARVQHEHIVAIHRVVDDGDLLAFEMEYVDGPNLQAVLEHLRAVRAAGTAPGLRHVAELLQLPADALGVPNLTQFFVRIALRIAGALGAVHRAGFVHRDVKPANVLLRRNGVPVLADFGLVRHMVPERGQKTQFVGTPVYSPPEQLRGAPLLGPAADVYALGVTLYECLVLRPPFAGRSTTELLGRIETGAAPPLRRAAHEAPRDLETIVAHAMELEPERRYADGGAFAADLQRLLDLQPILARPAGPLRRFGKFLRRNQRTLLAAGLGAALVAGATFPVLGAASAARRSADAARDRVAAARLLLLGPECRPGAAAATGALAASGAADKERVLKQALARYDEALQLRPDDAAARRERAVVRLWAWLRSLPLRHADSFALAIAAPEYHTLVAEVPPLVRTAAEALGRGTSRTLDLSAPIAAADPASRSALGLFAFLAGEVRWCEQAFAGVDGGERTLRDGALGLLHLDQGAHERAYALLQSAQRDLPGASFALELADAAMLMGETALAKRWLAAAPAADATAAVRRRIAADLELAAGDTEAAVDAYHELAAAAPLQPLPHYRLAQVAMRDGDLRSAAERLDELLQRWPELAAARLDRGRVALQQHDAAAYLAQVRATLARARGTGAGRGWTADRLELLRVGGLAALHHDAVAAAGDGRCGRGFLGGELPLRAFVPPAVVDRAEALLPLLADLDRTVQEVCGEVPALGATAAWWTLRLPLLGARLPAVAGALPFAPRLLCEVAPLVAPRLATVVSPLLQLWEARLFRSVWSLVDLHQVQAPADLAPCHVLGSALASGADWNGDGVPEVLVGCEAADPTAARGRVEVVDGRTCRILFEVVGDSDAHLFGHSVALLGDVDGDGVADWLVGAPAGTRQARQGFVELRSGRDGSRIVRLDGDGAAFGVDVAGLGDVDGDGVPDFAVGIPPIVRNGAAQGRVVLYSGRTRQVLRGWDNDLPGAWFGASVAGVGDVDGDGVPDLAVGGNFGDAPGLVRVCSGRTGAVVHSLRDDDPDSGFGALVAPLGDVDGDGRGDFAVSAIRAPGGDGVDAVHVFSGRTGSRLLALRGERSGARFGTGVARCDLPGRRLPLIVVGAAFGGVGASGTVEFYALDGTRIALLRGPGSMTGFGGWIAPVADVDGDGIAEWFVAGPRAGARDTVHRFDSTGLRLPK